MMETKVKWQEEINKDLVFCVEKHSKYKYICGAQNNKVYLKDEKADFCYVDS